MASSRGRGLLTYLRQQQAEMLTVLEAMTKAESPSSVPKSQAQVQTIFADELTRLDFKIIRVPGRSGSGHLYACPEQRNRRALTQLLIGHCDTVWPLGTLEEMPFQVTGNRVKGPGVFDMKGGLVQMLFALRAVRDLDLEMPLTPVVFVNSDEEIGSRDSGRYIRMLAQRVERTYVLEPALGPAGKIKTARKGVGRFTVDVQGQAAHAGLDPGSGTSAILELSYVIQQLFALNDPNRGVTVNVGTIDGGIRPNVIAPKSQAVVDVRVQTQEDAQRIEQALLNLKPSAPGATLSVEGRIGRPAMERTPRNQALWSRARELGEEIGLQLEEGLAGGGSDGNTASQYTATLDGLGPVGDGAHARHEFLYLDKTIERTALLALLLTLPPLDFRDG